MPIRMRRPATALKPLPLLRDAVDAFCRSCLHDPLAEAELGDWKQQVSACTAQQCPLFPVRHQSTPKNSGETRGRASSA